MVDVLEGALVIGALGLDIYAYKKMKDAESAAEDAVRQRERDRFKNTAGVSVEVTPQPAAAGADVSSTTVTQPLPGTADTHVQTSLTEHGMEQTTVHTDWKPVTYESVAPVQHTHDDEQTDETTSEEDETQSSPSSIEMQTITNQYDNITHRLDAIDERVNDQDAKISVMETKFDHWDGELEKSNETLRNMTDQLQHIEIPADQVEQIVNVKFSKSNEKLSAQIKDQGKKLQTIENKLDSHIIATPETALIKRDLREEFLPMLSEPKTTLEAHSNENRKEFKALSVRITQARDAALKEAQSKASKSELKRVVASIKTDVQKVQTRLSARKSSVSVSAKTAPKTKIAPKIVGTTVGKSGTAKKKTAVKSTKTTVVKTTKTTTVKTAPKPKSKIQAAVHEYAKTRKAKKTKPKTAEGNEVTVTTQVPKGTHVSTEVITGNKT